MIDLRVQWVQLSDRGDIAGGQHRVNGQESAVRNSTSDRAIVMPSAGLHAPTRLAAEHLLGDGLAVNRSGEAL
jgi:hypothetical protein